MENNSNFELLSKMNLLYAEDEFDLRESLSQTLKLIFKNVYIAKDGLEAIKIFDKHTIHMVLLDYVMPQYNGFEVSLHIRNKNNYIPIIIGSAYSDQEKLFNAINSGVISYLEKPFNEETLMRSFFLGIKKLGTQNRLVMPLTNSFSYDCINKKIMKSDTLISLSKQEILIFELLLDNKGKLVEKKYFEEKIFDGSISDNSLRTIIYRLRKKIGDDLIVTIPDLGYKII